jgi:hypothetical protein
MLSESDSMGIWSVSILTYNPLTRACNMICIVDLRLLYNCGPLTSDGFWSTRPCCPLMRRWGHCLLTIRMCFWKKKHDADNTRRDFVRALKPIYRSRFDCSQCTTLSKAQAIDYSVGSFFPHIDQSFSF